MCRTHRKIVVGKQFNSLTQGPGLDLQDLQPRWMHLLADLLRQQMMVHPLL